jgi:hypothetical protein
MSDPVLSKISPKKKLHLKRKKFYDEYVLTNKHIICKFKYLITCFDCPNFQNPENSDLESAGFVSLSKLQLDEFFQDQPPELDSSKDNKFLLKTVEELKKWHPSISRVEIDCKNIYDGIDINDYETDHIAPLFRKHLMALSRNNCVKSDAEYEIFKTAGHKVLDIKVSFELIKKIARIEDYHVNFNYLHQLLLEHITKWNQKECYFFDELSVKASQIPFAELLGYEVDETCDVYPVMHLIPLFPVPLLNENGEEEDVDEEATDKADASADDTEDAEDEDEVSNEENEEETPETGSVEIEDGEESGTEN